MKKLALMKEEVMRHSSLFLGAKSALASCALASTLLITGCSGGGGGSAPDFTVSDFDGNWSLQGISFALLGNEHGDGNLKGWITLNSSGDVLDGNFTNSNDREAALSGGSVSMNENGEFNGTAVAEVEEIASNIDIYSGKMAPSKELFAWVQTSSYIGTNDLGAAVKQGGTFTTSDLQGKWYMFGPSVGGELDSPEGTVWGKFELNTGGNVDSGEITTSDSMNISAVSGTIKITRNGEVNGTIKANSDGEDLNITVNSGKMAPSKNLMLMTTHTSQPLNSNELIAAVKSGEGAIYNPVDLKGRWYLHGVSMGSMSGKSTVSGYMDVDADETITGGVYISTGEDLLPIQAQILSGEIYIDINEKVVKGAFQMKTGDVDTNVTITYGRVSTSKDVALMVTKDALGKNAFVIAIKGE